MKAFSVNSRYLTDKVFDALEQGQTIALNRRGKLKGYIVPADPKNSGIKAEDHPFFGSRAADHEGVTAIIKRLRSPR